MLRNYFKTAWRSLLRSKVFTLINILGLAIGISASLVIYLIVHYDFTFDKYEQDNGRIYRVVSNTKYSGVPYFNRAVPAPVAETIRKEVTGVREVSAFHMMYQPVVKVPGINKAQSLTLKKQEDIILADPSYFKIVGYQWLAGSAATALNEPFKVVLTESRAKLYFPDLAISQIMGKEIIYEDSIRTTVSGIVKDITENTGFTFHDMISLATVNASPLKREYRLDNWGMTNGSSQTFIKLAPGGTVPQIERQLKIINAKYVTKHKSFESAYVLQPLNDIHFSTIYRGLGGSKASKPVLYGLLMVAAFLLLLGCINFINLSTAHAAHRAKEIGVRKTMGSSKMQLIIQFLSETGLITILATLLSIALIPILLKIFADFIPKGLHFNLLHQPDLALFLVLLVVTVSLLSGFYPSWVLSRFNPVLVLKNQAYANTGKTRRTWLRTSLTVFQFLVAQVFIMGTFIVAKQIHYTLNKDLGFKKDAIIYFSTPWADKHPGNKMVLVDELKTLPGIELVSLGGNTPSTDNTMSGQINFKDGKKEISTDVQFKYGDPNFIKVYQIQLLAGNNVQMDDTVKRVLVNETYAHILGFANAKDAVGKTVDWNGVNLPIIGLMKDFNQQSLHEPIKPLVFAANNNYSYEIHIALKPENADGTAWKNTIEAINKEYNEIYPGQDFEYEFYDEAIAKFYTSEQHISSLLTWATGLAIFISCLGLLGLVIYTTNLRTKEIGIRKVLGASVANLVGILSTDFVKLVLVSFVIAAPIAWWGMQKWLQNYAYRTTVNWWVFALSGTLMVVIALATLSVQTIRAAVANPVKSLRSE